MNDTHQQIVETAATRVATAAQYTGSGGAVAFGLSSTEWSVVGVIGGLLIAFFGFMVNWYYRERHYRLAEAKAREWSPLSDE